SHEVFVTGENVATAFGLGTARDPVEEVAKRQRFTSEHFADCRSSKVRVCVVRRLLELKLTFTQRSGDRARVPAGGKLLGDRGAAQHDWRLSIDELALKQL